MNLFNLIKVGALGSLVLASSGSAAPRPFYLELSPFFGSGQATNTDQVLYSAGLSLGADYRFQFDSFNIGPRLEILNTLMGMKSHQGEINQLSTFDNRIFAAGLRIGKYIGGPAKGFELFATGMLGRGKSRLQIDESSKSTFSAQSLSDIDGQYFATEVGGSFFLQENLQLVVSLHTNRYTADLSNAKGNSDTQEVTESGLALSEGETSPTDVPDKATLTMLAGKVGISLAL